MDDFAIPTDPPAIVRPLISNEERAAQLVQEARELDGLMRTSIRVTADQMVQRGQLLLKAQQLAGRGKFDAVLANHWPEISRSTAYRNMRLVTDEAKTRMVELVESHTHMEIDDKDFDDEEEGKPPPLTIEERKRMYALIGTGRPGLANKLRTGAKKLTDAELIAEVPLCCDKCRRFGPPPRPCEICARLRSEQKASLFETEQEPADENDPASPPAPPPDPYAEAKKLLPRLSTIMTTLAANDAALYEALVACRLIDHAAATPKFCALAGVNKVIEMVEAGETIPAIKAAYDIASGGFVPPRFANKRPV